MSNSYLNKNDHISVINSIYYYNIFKIKMGCVKSSHLDKYEKSYGGAYNLNQNNWLDKPPDGYQGNRGKGKCCNKSYESQIRGGCGCEGIGIEGIAGIAVLGGAGYGAAAVSHGIYTAETCGQYGIGCEGGDAAGCGAGGCGGCGGCGA